MRQKTVNTGMGTSSECFPFLPINLSLPEDADKQTSADVLIVRTRNPDPSTPYHELVIAAGRRRFETERPKVGDEFFPFDWTNRRRQATWRISMRLPSISGIGE